MPLEKFDGPAMHQKQEFINKDAYNRQSFI